MGSSVMLASFRATLIRTPKPSSFQFLPHPPTLFFLPRYHNYVLYASSSAAALETASSPSSPAQNCSWPEWSTFVDRLKSRGYLLPTTTSFEDTDDPRSLYKDINVLKNACLSFARDRFDVFNSLSKDDVQALVESGCPNINRKVVNSAKRLRAYTGLDEADVCGVCVLRESCDRAYVTLQESELAARTVDIVRILLLYALEQSSNSDGVKPAAREQAELSARRLLSELVELSEAPPEAGLEKPPGNVSYKKQPSGNISVDKDSKVPKNVDTARGDWTCTECSFLNFSRNVKCLKCSEPNPTKNDSQGAEMKKGDWSCPECSFLNFSRNVKCLKCSEPNPTKNDNQEAELRKGDWSCPECNFINFSRNTECLKCKAEGPKKVNMINIEMKKGDWNCPGCGYMNFSNNKKCHRCTESRPPRQMEPGEWECPSCDFLNFRRNVACRKCQCEKPEEKACSNSSDRRRRPVDMDRSA